MSELRDEQPICVKLSSKLRRSETEVDIGLTCPNDLIAILEQLSDYMRRKETRGTGNEDFSWGSDGRHSNRGARGSR